MNRIKSFFRSAWSAIRPGERAVKGAAWGVLAAGALVYLLFALAAAEGPLAPGAVVALVVLAMGALLLFLGQGLAKGIELLASIPWRLRWTLLGALLLITMALIGLKEVAGLAVIAYLLGAAALLGGGVAALLGTGWPCLTWPQRIISLGGVILGTLALMAGLGWYGLSAGFAEPPVENAAKTGAPPEQVTLPDPSQPGPYAVATLTYGAGTDRYRPEFASGAAIQTGTVDGTKLLENSWNGFTGQLRALYWGFDAKALPINGRVWYPTGGAAGEKYPLVVIVHGNHLGSDFSDPGYAYLGELLASRGYIFVSVDENFINSMTLDFFQGFRNENDARGWLLLEHLRAWAAFNRTTSNPFYGRVDLDSIAVMGHSRGGEAAAVAAAFNRLPYLPDDYGLAFDYNFNIKAVVAIAPIDGQYAPAWRPTPLSDVNYLVLQGSHDADLTSFDGLDPYERVKLSAEGGWFKAAVYIYRANHGQFNSVWGDNDTGLLRGGFLNRAALLSGADQAQAAKVYISAFLDAALRGETGYLPLFQDARAAGDGWLPDTIYISRLDRAGDRLLATFDDDINLRSASLPGAAIRGENFTAWREQRIQTRWGSFENSAVYLGWNEARVATYTLTLPESGFPTTTGAGYGALIFNLADANQDPPPGGDAKAGKKTGETPRQPLDLTVMLVDAAGEKAALPLSRYLPVQPQIKARLYKGKLFEPYTSGEPVLQSYVLPLEDFVEANPKFDPAGLREIRFVFDRTKRGSVVLDAVGVRGR